MPFSLLPFLAGAVVVGAVATYMLKDKLPERLQRGQPPVPEKEASPDSAHRAEAKPTPDD